MKNKTNSNKKGGKIAAEGKSRRKSTLKQSKSGRGKTGNSFSKQNNRNKTGENQLKNMGKGTVIAKIDGTNRGFAFLLLDSGDLYIPREKLGGARHGDTVKAIVSGDKAEVVSVLSRGFTTIVGTYFESSGYGYVLPDNKHFNDIPIKRVGAGEYLRGYKGENFGDYSENYGNFVESFKVNKDKIKGELQGLDNRKKNKDGKSKDGNKLLNNYETNKTKRGAESGDKVVVAFKEDGRAVIIEVLGKADDEKVMLKSIMRSYGFAEKFPRAALKNANEVCHISPEDLANREDFRQDIVFTIDGEDSRDFDDAVSIKKLANGYILSVHIADVAHYVRHSGPLDNEAYNRATSVYFPFGVVPMLPPLLSDDICSLKQGEDRLSLSVIMHIDSSGNVYKHRIVEGVIRSVARLTYPLAAAILEGNVKEYLNLKAESKSIQSSYDNNLNDDSEKNPETSEGINSQKNPAKNPAKEYDENSQSEIDRKYDGNLQREFDEDYNKNLKLYKSLALPLKHMRDLCDILLAARKQRGAIEFESSEPQIDMDGARVTGVKKAETLITHKIIEEFMVLTNCTVAKQFNDIAAPFVYRVHAAPPAEKLQRLDEFLQKVGLSLLVQGEEPVPADFATLLENTPADLKEVVSAVALRAMSKAEYLPQCKGHYGLSLQHYCHFTSPIRRYPDLVIHRIIKAWLNDEKLDKFRDFVQIASHQSSVKERAAEEAERQVNDLLIAKYMADFIGEAFEGTVSGITEWGIFVRLPNTAEGLVRVENIKGLYRLEGYGIAAIDDSYYKLGQRVKVKLFAVSGEKLEFVLEDFLSSLPSINTGF